MRYLPCLLMLVLCVGCANNPWTFKDMTADQINAVSKIKDAGVLCAHGVYAGATVTVISINADKGVPSNMVVDESCKTTFTSGAQKP